MNRFVYVIGTCLFSALALAATPEVCGILNQTNVYLAQQCRTAARGKLFEPGAIHYCAELAQVNGYLAVECVKAVANKAYSSDELKDCGDQQSNGYLLNQCLTSSGTNVCQ